MTTISSPADDLDHAVVLADALEGAEEAIDGQRRGEERDAEAERVDREQRRAVRHRAFPRREREDRAEDRADARGPAEGEGQADDERAERTGRLALHVDLRLAVEGVDLQQPHRVQAEEDHGDAGDLA